MTTDSAAASARPTKRRRGFLVFLRDVLVIVVIAALVSFVVKTFIVRSFYIPSASMERTLLVNDRILVDELTPRWTAYERGDVVVFKDPGGWLDGQPQTPAQPPLVEAAALAAVERGEGKRSTDPRDHLVVHRSRRRRARAGDPRARGLRHPGEGLAGVTETHATFWPCVASMAE